MLASEYGFTDIYNGCLLRLLLRFNNTGPPDAVLYDMPLGLWDHDWIGCFNSRSVQAGGARPAVVLHERYGRKALIAGRSLQTWPPSGTSNGGLQL
jgi:hypothetical protein